MSKVADGLRKVLANTYLLYVKTQNYHWNVSGGPYFKTLHELFEMHYEELYEAIDKIAERIRQLGEKSPGSFSEFNQYALIKEGQATKKSLDMIRELADDQIVLAKLIKENIDLSNSQNDDVTADLLIERLAAHQKAAWFYNSSVE